MFRETEPDSPIHIASLARFLLMNGERRRAADLLDGFDRAIGWRNTFFLATRAEAAYELGDTETLDRVLQSWPEPRDGFAFLKWNGVRYEESVGDAAAAVESYRKAAALWPGPTDWQLLFRLANGMTRLGERSEADRLRARSTELEALVGDDVHRPLRIALSDMTNPAEIDRLAAFYSKIDRPFEAGLWREYSDGLRQAAAARDGSGRTSVGSSLVDPFLGGPSGATSSSFSIGPFHPAP